MRKIELTACTIWDFRSFEYAAIEFPTNPGFRFIGGDNQSEPSLGANGAGKSTLWDAVFWCLWGVSVRGFKASELTRWGSDKCSVVVSLIINAVQFKIKRESNPNRISINDALAPQEEVNSLVGLTAEQARHSIFFGQGVRLLPDLSMSERAALLDSALDIGLWARCGSATREELTKLHAAAHSCALELAQANGQLKTIAAADIDKLKIEADDFEANREAEVKRSLERIQILEEKCNKLRTRIELQKVALNHFPDTKKTKAAIRDMRERVRLLEGEKAVRLSKRTQAGKLIAFYESQTDCPTCRQHISVKFANEQRLLNQQLIAELDIELADIKNQQAKFSEAIDRGEAKVAKLGNQCIEQAAELYNDEARLLTAEKEIRALAGTLNYNKRQENPYLAQLETMQAQEKEAKKLKAKASRDAIRLKGQILIGTYWKEGFARLRLYQLRRTLDYLTLQTSNFAESLGLCGWQISFVTETETKSGTSRLGIQIIVVAPSGNKCNIELYSGGEAERIRLSIALGFATMLQHLAGINWPLEVWDEPGRWLSPEGMEALLTTLSHRSTAENKTIWLMSHTALTFAGFSDIWTVIKTSKGSNIQ